MKTNIKALTLAFARAFWVWRLGTRSDFYFAPFGAKVATCAMTFARDRFTEELFPVIRAPKSQLPAIRALMAGLGYSTRDYHEVVETDRVSPEPRGMARVMPEGLSF